MQRAEQDQLQTFVNEMRKTRAITPLCRDLAEAMIWKCRKQPDGSFMAGYKALAAMTKGCCRDTAIQAVAVLRRIGFLVKEKTRVWCAALQKWVQGKNVYRLISPGFSESEFPTPSTSKSLDSLLTFLPLETKEEAREGEHAAALLPISPDSVTVIHHECASSPAPGAVSPDEPGEEAPDRGDGASAVQPHTGPEGRSAAKFCRGAVPRDAGASALRPLVHGPVQREANDVAVGHQRPPGAAGSGPAALAARRTAFLTQQAARMASRRQM